MGVTAPLAPSLTAFAVPDKGCGLAVPGLCGLLKPGGDLGGRLGLLARQGPIRFTLHLLSPSLLWTGGE